MLKLCTLAISLLRLTCTPAGIEEQINQVLDDYYDLAILMQFDQDDHVAHLAIGGYLTSGTDLGCQEFAEMVRRIAQLDARISFEIYGSFVPCLVNPIPNEWARRLANEHELP